VAPSQHSNRPAAGTTARTLGEAASLSDRAIVVGNRAGIVEWANASWTRITGCQLSETVAKPITHFLEQTSIDLELVEFVGQNFLEGRASTLEFPFETFDNRDIWVHLEVQPIRNEQGEVCEFVAVATDISERHQQERNAPLPSPSRDPLPGTDSTTESRSAIRTPQAGKVTRFSLSAETRVACERTVRNAAYRTHFDLELDACLPSIEADRLLLSEVIQLLLLAATIDSDESWEFVTVMTGQTRIGRSHVSPCHPVVARPAQLAKQSFLFVEVHDTAPTLSPGALDAIRAGTRVEEPRADSLAMASALASALGGQLHIDSTPGCGTQSLLLLPSR
jgi:PAS domain S-box-containing protein